MTARPIARAGTGSSIDCSADSNCEFASTIFRRRGDSTELVHCPRPAPAPRGLDSDQGSDAGIEAFRRRIEFIAGRWAFRAARKPKPGFEARIRGCPSTPTRNAQLRVRRRPLAIGNSARIRRPATNRSSAIEPAVNERTPRSPSGLRGVLNSAPDNSRHSHQRDAAAQARDRGNRHREKDHSSHRTLLNWGLGLAGHHDRLSRNLPSSQPEAKRTSQKSRCSEGPVAAVSRPRRAKRGPAAPAGRRPARGGEPREPTPGGRSDEGGTRSCRPREKPPTGLEPVT
jgi:hypothetical protein